MGRGRAKAKQAKVARMLKYDQPETDLDRLSRELATPPSPAGEPSRRAASPRPDEETDD
ncbi:DUF3073 domain-containing protein [Spirillospora sp. NPDC052269]